MASRVEQARASGSGPEDVLTFPQARVIRVVQDRGLLARGAAPRPEAQALYNDMTPSAEKRAIQKENLPIRRRATREKDGPPSVTAANSI